MGGSKEASVFQRLVIANTSFRGRVGAEFGVGHGGSPVSRASQRAIEEATPRFLYDGHARAEYEVRMEIHQREDERDLQSTRERRERVLVKQMARISAKVSE